MSKKAAESIPEPGKTPDGEPEAAETPPDGQDESVGTDTPDPGLSDPSFRFWMTFKNEVQNASQVRAQLAREVLTAELAKHPVSATYNLLFLYDESSLVRTDADSIYDAISGFSEAKPILMVLYSPGGQIEPAYLIGKLCREHSKHKFVVVVESMPFLVEIR